MGEITEVLRAVRDLHGEGPHRWTKRALARRADYAKVNPTDEDAVAWCVSGILWRAARSEAVTVMRARQVVCRVLKEAKKAAPYITTWNDYEGRTYEEVMDMWDKAVKYADDKGL